MNKLLGYDCLKIKNGKIYDTNKNFSKLEYKSDKEVEAIEKKLRYIKTQNLEKELPSDSFNIFGRTYMDKINFKALE